MLLANNQFVFEGEVVTLFSTVFIHTTATEFFVTLAKGGYSHEENVYRFVFKKGDEFLCIVEDDESDGFFYCLFDAKSCDWQPYQSVGFEALEPTLDHLIAQADDPYFGKSPSEEIKTQQSLLEQFKDNYKPKEYRGFTPEEVEWAFSQPWCICASADEVVVKEGDGHHTFFSNYNLQYWVKWSKKC